MQSLSVEMILEVRGQGFKEVLILFFVFRASLQLRSLRHLTLSI